MRTIILTIGLLLLIITIYIGAVVIRKERQAQNRCEEFQKFLDKGKENNE